MTNNITKAQILEFLDVKELPGMDRQEFTPFEVISILAQHSLSPEKEAQLIEVVNAAILNHFTPLGDTGNQAHELAKAQINVSQLQPQYDALFTEIDAKQTQYNRIKRGAKTPTKASDLMRLEAKIEELKEKLAPIQTQLNNAKGIVEAAASELPLWFIGLKNWASETPETTAETT